MVLDKKGDELLLVSRYALDYYYQDFTNPYHPEIILDYSTKVFWECSHIQDELNRDEFLNAHFSDEEKEKIQDTTIESEPNCMGDIFLNEYTVDKLFLLSSAEVEKYFSSDKDRRCAPTEYSLSRGNSTYKHSKVNGKACCCWWLRSPGDSTNSATYVTGWGEIYSQAGCVSLGIRPAMWVKI